MAEEANAEETMEIQPREIKLEEKPLWGGHMRISIPVGFVDVSNLRNIPNHQELYTDASKDQSLSLELLGKVDEEDDKAGKYHFDEIARANDCLGNTTFVEEGIIKVDAIAEGKKVSCIYYVG